MSTVPVASWGRLPAHEHDVVSLTSPARIASTIGGSKPGIAFGNGRSYGDVGLNPGGTLWLARPLDHLIAFDAEAGILRCEAGMLLRDIQRLTLPKGWLLPVTPGTQLITVGGAIANDIHGKNHHVAGSFGDHVLSLTLVRTDGTVRTCTRTEHADWLAATIGGMGLTGVIAEATLALKRVPGPWLETETIAFSNLDAFFRLADQSEQGWEQTVAWIDCASAGRKAGRATRGIFLRANPAQVTGKALPKAASKAVPFTPPVSFVNRWTLRPFNAAYYVLNAMKEGLGIAHYEPFSYPLDNLDEWNRLYGPDGFYQYQSVVPRTGGPEAIGAMLAAIAEAGDGSLLAVLKTFGDRASPGMMSFPKSGVTLALDFPNRGPSTLRLFERLDAIVRQAGGRLYPAKDARMPRDLFEAGYPRLAEFLPFRDPGISSGMSRRLMGF